MKPSFHLIANGVASALRAPACRFVLGMAIACGAPAIAADTAFPDHHGVIRQAGDLDPAFGTDGRVILSVDDAGGLAAPQSALTPDFPDPKILSVGIISSDTVFLVRMGPEGWPDFDFGQGGSIRVPLGIDGQFALRDRIVLPDGRLVLAGSVVRPGGTNLLYVRLTSDGRLDPTFGVGGLTEIRMPSGDNAQAQHIVLLPDGKIVAAARSLHASGGGWDSVLIRLTTDGRLDTSFAFGGIAVHPLRSALVRRVHLLSDGKLLLSGMHFEYGLLSRYHADGQLDETFGTDGHFRMLAPGILDNNHINDVALQDDGKFVVVGAAGGLDQTSVIARIEADGSGFDPDFNDGVPVLVPSSEGTSEEAAVALQPDGKIVSLGKASIRSTVFGRVVRLHADGSFDMGFGQGGIVMTAPNAGAQHLLGHLQIQPDGKYVASGLVHDAGRDSLGIFRFLAK